MVLTDYGMTIPTWGYTTDCGTSPRNTAIDVEFDYCGFSKNHRINLSYESSAACGFTSNSGKIKFQKIYSYDWSASSAITTITTKCSEGFCYDTSWDYVQATRVVPSLEDRISEIIRNRVSPKAITQRKGMDHANDIREMRARQTLRRVVGDQKFYAFLKKGFVTVAAKTGLVYQIYPGHGITKVWDGGRVVERLCVVLRGEFPPTDSLIMRYLMILNNEDQFRSLAIKHMVSDFHQPVRDSKVETVQQSLVDLFNELKKRHRVAA